LEEGFAVLVTVKVVEVKKVREEGAASAEFSSVLFTGDGPDSEGSCGRFQFRSEDSSPDFAASRAEEAFVEAIASFWTKREMVDFVSEKNSSISVKRRVHFTWEGFCKARLAS
jgi:hypothetical protein